MNRASLLIVVLIVIAVLTVASAAQTASLQIIHTQGVIGAHAIFTDNLETGDLSKWTSTAYSVGGTWGPPFAQSNIVFKGTYSAEADIWGSPASYAWAQENLTSTYTTLYVSEWILVPAGSSLPASGQEVVVSPVIQDITGTQILAALCLYNNNGTYEWELQYATNSVLDNCTYSAPLNNAYSATPTFTTNSWYHVEIGFVAGAGNGEVQAWIAPNGTSISQANPAISVIGLTNNAMNAGYVECGTYFLAATGPSQLSSPFTLIFDEVSITTTFSGIMGDMDITPPTFGVITASNTGNGTSVLLSCSINDNVNVSSYFYSWNNTGQWVNQTAIAWASNPATFSGTWESTVGDTVSVKVYANDTSNNWATSSQYNFKLTITSYGYGYLHCDGIWIVDAHGYRIQLRGCACDYKNSGDWAGLESYLRYMQSFGINVVRLPFSVPNHQDQGSVYNPVDMDRTLALCQKYGIYAILDNHAYGQFVEQNWTQDWINNWVNIATRYANNSIVAGYELCNEPYSIYFPSVAIPCLNAIRQVDTNHIVFLAEYTGNGACWEGWQEGDIYTGRRYWIPPNYTGTRNGQSACGAVIPNDTNIAFTCHCWCITNGAIGDLQAFQCKASEYVYLMLSLRNTLQRPVIAGEFGSYNLTAGSNEMVGFMMTTIQMCENESVPWLSWPIAGIDHNYPWDYIIPTPYTSSIVPSNVPIDVWPGMWVPSGPFSIAKPFNMLNYISGWNRREIGYNWWGVSFYTFASSHDWITFNKTCQVKVIVWATWDDFYNRVAPLTEIIVDISAGDTLNASTYWNSTSPMITVYAYSAP